MLVFHNVPSVRRLSKLGASTLLRRFYACRTIQRFVRTRFAFPHGAVATAPYEGKTRDLDASMSRAMQHILACTIEAAVAADASAPTVAAYAADLERIVARLYRLSPTTALAVRRRWLETLLRVAKDGASHGALDDAVAALREARPRLCAQRSAK